jgi:uncharacterized protein (UPF0305 family)
VAFLACGVLQLELEQVLQQIRTEGLFDCEITATYLQAGLHIDLSGGRSIESKHGNYFCPLKKKQLHEPLSLCQYCVSRESGAIGNE